MSDINEITKEIIQFRDERNWEQFHNAKDLAVALNVEAGELLELFLWKQPEEVNVNNVKAELADVLNFAFLLAHKYSFDVKDIILQKIEENKNKYPIDKSKGTAKKYNAI